MKQSTTDGQQVHPLKLKRAFETFVNGEPVEPEYIIKSLLTQGTFSILGAKPKVGKSSYSRYEAVCVAKGIPMLGRETTRGEVLLISLEDSQRHVDNHLHALGYDRDHDEEIYIVNELPVTIDASIAAIEETIKQKPNIRLVIVDTLAKLLRVDDMDDFPKVMQHVEKVSKLARKYPHLHIQGTVHCKKAVTDSPFDALLGSTALRAEASTNIVLYEEGLERVIAAEAREGIDIDATLIHAQMVISAGTQLVQDYHFGKGLREHRTDNRQSKEQKTKESLSERIVAYLSNRPHEEATYKLLLEDVEGKKESKIEAVEALITQGRIKVTGVKGSKDPVNAYTLHLDRNWEVNAASQLIHRFSPGAGSDEVIQ